MSDLDRLKLMTAWDTAPLLTEDDLSAVLSKTAVKDVLGLEPGNEEWTATYDLNAAASRAWLIKAARAAAMIDEPTAGPITSKVFDNCRAMARTYAAKRAGSVPIN